MLKVRVLEELPADDARLAGDVNVSVALCRALDIWLGQDLWFALNLYTRVPQKFQERAAHRSNSSGINRPLVVCEVMYAHPGAGEHNKVYGDEP